MNRSRLLQTVLVVATVALAVSGVVDDTSRDIAQKSFTRALVTFAAARTLNGVISAAQGTEVALEPGGVGVVLSIGEALDPINDLVERFSSVMLVAASSLGLQNILLGISRWWGMNAALGAVAIAVIIAVWVPARDGARGRRLYAAITMRMFLMLMFLRFVIPLLIIGTNLVSEAFLDEGLAESAAALEATTVEIEEISEAEAPPDTDDRSLMDRLGSMIDESLQSMNASRRLQQLKEAASGAAEHIVNLIVIFVLQTILLPLALFWVLLEIMKGWISRMARGEGAA